MRKKTAKKSMILLGLMMLIGVTTIGTTPSPSHGETEKAWDAHESHTKMHFDDNEMEFPGTDTGSHVQLRVRDRGGLRNGKTDSGGRLGELAQGMG